MKLFVIAFTMLCAAFTTTARANDVKVSPIVLNVFENTFTEAKDVRWSVVESLYRVDFSKNGHHVTAFYDSRGTIVASSRIITTEQLPISLQNSIVKKTKDATVLELFELNDENGTNYYVTIVNKGKKSMLKSASGNWYLYKKFKS